MQLRDRGLRVGPDEIPHIGRVSVLDYAVACDPLACDQVQKIGHLRIPLAEGNIFCFHSVNRIFVKLTSVFLNRGGMVSLLGLRTLVAVVETGNIRAAAHRIGRTPSAVSMMLKQLEGDVGGALFAGDRKNLLSDLGIRVHAEAKPLLEHYSRASAAMTSFAANQIGRCDVACVPSIAANFLPEAIAKARDRIGPFSIQVRDMDSRAVIEAVEEGGVEVGFCVISQLRAGLVFEPLFRERLDFVCRRDHHAARTKRPVAWDDVDCAEFIANGSAATSPPSAPAPSSIARRCRPATSPRSWPWCRRGSA